MRYLARLGRTFDTEVEAQEYADLMVSLGYACLVWCEDEFEYFRVRVWELNSARTTEVGKNER